MKRVTRFVQAEIERETGATPEDQPGGKTVEGRQSVIGWALLGLLLCGFVWIGARNLQVLAFNVFLGITLAFAVGTRVLVFRV